MLNHQQGYTTRINSLYNKDKEVMFSDAIIEPPQKTFALKGVKSPRKKSLVFCKFCLTSRILLVSVLLSALVERCSVSRMRDLKKD